MGGPLIELLNWMWTHTVGNSKSFLNEQWPNISSKSHKCELSPRYFWKCSPELQVQLPCSLGSVCFTLLWLSHHTRPRVLPQTPRSHSRQQLELTPHYRQKDFTMHPRFSVHTETVLSLWKQNLLITFCPYFCHFMLCREVFWMLTVNSEKWRWFTCCRSKYSVGI